MPVGLTGIACAGSRGREKVCAVTGGGDRHRATARQPGGEDNSVRRCSANGFLPAETARSSQHRRSRSRPGRRYSAELPHSVPESRARRKERLPGRSRLASRIVRIRRIACVARLVSTADEHRQVGISRKARVVVGLAAVDERGAGARGDVAPEHAARAQAGWNAAGGHRHGAGMGLIGKMWSANWMPGVGVEPTRGCPPGILSPLRLPVPPPGRAERETGLEPATPTLARLCSTN